MGNEAKKAPEVVRSFALTYEGHKTTVQIQELNDGSMEVALITARDNTDPLITAMRISYKTFALLSAALFRADHDESVWEFPKVKDGEL